MSGWRVLFTRQAAKDAKKVSRAGFKPKVEYLLEILATDPFRSPPPFEKFVGDLSEDYSRRINVLNRLVYQVLSIEKTVNVLRM